MEYIKTIIFTILSYFDIYEKSIWYCILYTDSVIFSEKTDQKVW